MVDIVFGRRPHDIPVQLVRDDDYDPAITWKDAAGQPVNFPAGAVLAFHFDDGTVWPALLDGTTARWDIDRTLVNVVIDGPVRRHALRYTAPGTVDHVWATGVVLSD